MYDIFKMALDPALDKPWVDFETNLDAIKIGKIDLKKSKLYQFLKPEIQTQINRALSFSSPFSVTRAIKIIEKAYGLSDIIPFWANIDTTYRHTSQNDFDDIQQTLLQLNEAKSKRDWIAYETCAFRSLHSIVNFTMMLTFKRFHKDFQMEDFLCCYVFIKDGQITTSKPIYRQMIASRMNYILNGKYLPIITYFADTTTTPIGHSTTQLLLPVVSNQMLTWNVVDINSNGSEQYRYFMDTTEMFDDYKLWTKNQRQNQSFKKNLSCFENIQKNFGTCGYWSMILVFQCFVDFNEFNYKHNNFETFCNI